MGEVREVGVEVRLCCKSRAVRLGSRSKGEVVRHSRIHRRSIDRFRDDTAGEWADDIVKVGPLRRSEAVVSVGLAVAEMEAQLMRCEIPSREERNLVVEA